VRARLAACDDGLLAQAEQEFGATAPFNGPTPSGMLTLHCPPGAVYALTRFLQDRGAEEVTVAEIDYVFSPTNPLFAKLEAALAQQAAPL
jgi:ATP phosphoribosyltransferase